MQGYLQLLEQRKDREALEGVRVCVRKRSVANRVPTDAALRAFVASATERYVGMLVQEARALCVTHEASRSVPRTSSPGTQGALGTHAALLEKTLDLVRAGHKAWRALPGCMEDAAKQRCDDSLHGMLANMIALLAWYSGLQGTPLRPIDLDVFRSLPAKVIQQTCADMEARSKGATPGALVAVAAMPGMLALVAAQHPPGAEHAFGALSATAAGHASPQLSMLPPGEAYAGPAASVPATPPRPKASVLSRKRLAGESEGPESAAKQPRLE